MSSKNLKRKDIKAYKEGAIACLRNQLERAKTEKRKAILQARIDKWESKDV